MSSHQLTRDELLDRLNSMADRIDDVEMRLNSASQKRDDLQEQVWGLEDELEEERAQNERLRDENDDLRDTVGQLERDRVRLFRRVAFLEQQVDGVDESNAAAVGDTTMTPLDLLAAIGPDAVAERDSKTLRRGRVLVEKRDDWGETLRNQKYGRHHVLGTRRHDLRSRLQDVRDEDLAWRQVYRAMEKLARLGGDDVILDEDYDGEKALVWTEVER